MAGSTAEKRPKSSFRVVFPRRIHITAGPDALSARIMMKSSSFVISAVRHGPAPNFTVWRLAKSDLSDVGCLVPLIGKIACEQRRELRIN
jgi:hypothetical protein